MYVCVCSSVTDSDIRDAVAEGCRTMRQLRLNLGVAAECGRCAQCARQVLEDAKCEHETYVRAPTYLMLASETS
jgi:bacterioferritin-associated ferredoxin